MSAETLEILLDEFLYECIHRDSKARRRSKQRVVYDLLLDYYKHNTSKDSHKIRQMIIPHADEIVSSDNEYVLQIVPDETIDAGLESNAVNARYVYKNEWFPLSKSEVALRILFDHYWEEIVGMRRAIRETTFDLTSASNLREVLKLAGLDSFIKSLRIEGWFKGLTSEQQMKLLEYWDDEERVVYRDSFPRSQKRFFWGVANNALIKKDNEFAIFMAEKGLQAEGSSRDQHFIYNKLIMALWQLGDYERAKQCCLSELDKITDLDKVLLKN